MVTSFCGSSSICRISSVRRTPSERWTLSACRAFSAAEPAAFPFPAAGDKAFGTVPVPAAGPASISSSRLCKSPCFSAAAGRLTRSKGSRSEMSAKETLTGISSLSARISQTSFLHRYPDPLPKNTERSHTNPIKRSANKVIFKIPGRNPVISFFLRRVYASLFYCL